MTDDEINAVLATAEEQRKRDAILAVLIGWQDVHVDEVGGEWIGIDPRGYTLEVPEFSRSMGTAWKVVQHMTSRMGYDNPGFDWRGPLFKSAHHYLTNEGYPLGTTCWYVLLEHNGLREYVCAETPEEAICLAALKTVEQQ